LSLSTQVITQGGAGAVSDAAPPAAVSDSVRIWQLLDASKEMQFKNYQQSLAYSLEALRLSKDMGLVS
jgi:hypothetical protein